MGWKRMSKDQVLADIERRGWSVSARWSSWLGCFYAILEMGPDLTTGRGHDESSAILSAYSDALHFA